MVGQDADGAHIIAVAGVDRTAAAGANLHLRILQAVRLPDGCLDLFHPALAEPLRYGSVDDEGELIPADAEHRIALPHAAPQAAGHLLEQLVAHIVAVTVVYGLETVKVEVEQDKRCLVQFVFFQQCVKIAFIIQSGQAVGVGQVLHLLAGLLFLPEGALLFLHAQAGIGADTVHQHDACAEEQARQQQDGRVLDLPHSAVHHVTADDAHNGQILKAHRLVDQIIALALKPVGKAAAAALCHVLPGPGQCARIHLRMLLQVIEQVVHPVLDLALGLLREHHIPVRMDDVAVALAAVGTAADQFLNGLIPVAHCKAGIGGAVDLHRRNGHRVYHPALPAPHDVAGHRRLAGAVRLLKGRPEVIHFFMLAPDAPIFAVFIEQIHAAVPPDLLFGLIAAQAFLRQALLIGSLQALAPLVQHIPVAPAEDGKRLIHLLIGLQQVAGALVIELLPDVHDIPAQTRHYDHRQQQRSCRPSFLSLPHIQFSSAESQFSALFPPRFRSLRNHAIPSNQHYQILLFLSRLSPKIIRCKFGAFFYPFAAVYVIIKCMDF